MKLHLLFNTNKIHTLHPLKCHGFPNSAPTFDTQLLGTFDNTTTSSTCHQVMHSKVRKGTEEYETVSFLSGFSV